MHKILSDSFGLAENTYVSYLAKLKRVDNTFSKDISIKKFEERTRVTISYSQKYKEQKLNKQAKEMHICSNKQNVRSQTFLSGLHKQAFHKRCKTSSCHSTFYYNANKAS